MSYLIISFEIPCFRDNLIFLSYNVKRTTEKNARMKKIMSGIGRHLFHLFIVLVYWQVRKQIKTMNTFLQK